MVVDRMLAHEERCEEAMLDKMLQMEQRIVATQSDAAAQVVAAADILELQATEAKHAFGYQAAVESEMQASGGFGGGAESTSSIEAAQQQYDAPHADIKAHASQLALHQHREMVHTGGSRKELRLIRERRRQQHHQQRHDSKDDRLLQRAHYEPHPSPDASHSLEAHYSAYDISAAGLDRGGSYEPESSVGTEMVKYQEAVEAR